MPAIVIRLVTAGAAAIAAVGARRAVEFGWRRFRGEEPPSASNGVVNETELRDMMMWSALLAISVLIARKLASDRAGKLLGAEQA